ncbi:MAG: hypothetical protein V1872_12170 [bacterium]
MNQQNSKDDKEHKETTSDPLAFPWYILFGIGVPLTGVFPWSMILWALYKKGKKKLALSSFIINLLIFLLFSWFIIKSKIIWWVLTSILYLFNLIWVSLAWVFQKRLIGNPKKRYRLNEWGSWLEPLLISAILGMCVVMVYSIWPTLYSRIEMSSSMDSLDRLSILWDLVKSSLIGLPVGLLVGFWWAGEDKKFRPVQPIIFLSACTLFSILWYLHELLFNFLVHRGSSLNSLPNLDAWSLFPPWNTGTYISFYQYAQYIEHIALLFLILICFNNSSRLRDFGMRLLLIPLIFSCLLPMSFANKERWEDIQDQIIYDTSSPKIKERERAFKWAENLLKRYPDHMQWPTIAEGLAQYYYKYGQIEKARVIYKEIVSRYRDSNQWYWDVKRCQAILASPDFGKPSSEIRLKIPMVDYEEYLNPNWMALLATIRFWKGEKVAESEIKIKLKELSQSEDNILLRPLNTFADLDDAAQTLGFEILILPAEPTNIQSLLSAGIPVIHQHYTTFNLLFGFDKNRSVFFAYSFDRLSERLLGDARKEVKEILELENEGRGESQKRLDRIANEAYNEESVEYWKCPALKYTGPLTAVIFPKEQLEKITTVLNTPTEYLKKENKGYLASLIAFSYLNHADPVKAIEWAKARRQEDKMTRSQEDNKTVSEEPRTNNEAMYIAYTAKKFWDARDRLIKTKLNLQDQFPELAQIFKFFNSPENINFLEQAQSEFETDIKMKAIPWFILANYLQTLDVNNPNDLKQIIEIRKIQLVLDPSTYYWQSLANNYELAEDNLGMIDALKGAVSFNPLDFQSKLRLSYLYIVLEKNEEAESVLDKINPREVRYDADYLFCLGAIAEWKGKTGQAINKYKAAIEMRRYKSLYHLRYGRLLLKEKRIEEAKKALEWAVKIDTGEKVREEAEELLEEMKRREDEKSRSQEVKRINNYQ